jgi:hypothetical protein
MAKRKTRKKKTKLKAKPRRKVVRRRPAAKRRRKSAKKRTPKKRISRVSKPKARKRRAVKKARKAGKPAASRYLVALTLGASSDVKYLAGVVGRKVALSSRSGALQFASLPAAKQIARQMVRVSNVRRVGVFKISESPAAVAQAFVHKKRSSRKKR